MLLVETNNSKEQSTLQEEFSREGNLFAVPMKKTSQINLILESILFEIFGQINNNAQDQHKNNYMQIQAVKKFMNFLENILNLRFSLSIVRQIFQLIKTRETKIKLYQEYILQLNQHFNNDLDEDELSQSINFLWRDTEIENMFQDQIAKNNHVAMVLDADLEVIGSRTELENCGSPKNDQIVKYSNVSIACDIESTPNNDDAKTMHTLKSQIPTSPKFSMTPLSEMNINLNAKLDHSFHYSQDSEPNEQDTSLVHVKDQLCFDRSTNSTFYCPSWKKVEEDNRRIVQSLMMSSEPTPKKTSLDESDYIENLSGRVHPIPSFLHNESLKQMIAKQKRQDVRKSNILKRSMHANQISKQNMPNQDSYTASLRMIKFQNKLRKNSKKNIASKKDINEVAQQVTQIKFKQKPKQRSQSKDKQQMKPKKIKQPRYSEGSLFRVKQDINQIDEQQQTSQNDLQVRINNLIQQKELQSQRKMSIANINYKKPLKSSNFFKSRP